MVYYLAKNSYKEHLFMENKNSNAFDGMKNDEVMKELPVQLSPSPSYPGLHVQL